MINGVYITLVKVSNCMKLKFDKFGPRDFAFAMSIVNAITTCHRHDAMETIESNNAKPKEFLAIYYKLN